MTEAGEVLLSSDLALPKQQGKVRDIYDLGDRLLLVATDRVSAFDVVLPTGVPDKGRTLTQMSAFWFEQTRGVVPNHMIRVIDSTENPDLPVALGPEYIGRTMLVRKAEPIRLEAIVRGYLSGSGWRGLPGDGPDLRDPAAAGAAGIGSVAAADLHALHEGGRGARREHQLRRSGGLGGGGGGQHAEGAVAGALLLRAGAGRGRVASRLRIPSSSSAWWRTMRGKRRRS